jgi:hypothetical protein
VDCGQSRKKKKAIIDSNTERDTNTK